MVDLEFKDTVLMEVDFTCLELEKKEIPVRLMVLAEAEAEAVVPKAANLLHWTHTFQLSALVLIMEIPHITPLEQALAVVVEAKVAKTVQADLVAKGVEVFSAFLHTTMVQMA